MSINKTYKCVYIRKDHYRTDAYSELRKQYTMIQFANKNPEKHVYQKVSVKDFFSLYLSEYDGPEVATEAVLTKAILKYATKRLRDMRKIKYQMLVDEAKESFDYWKKRDKMLRDTGVYTYMTLLK